MQIKERAASHQAATNNLPLPPKAKRQASLSFKITLAGGVHNEASKSHKSVPHETTADGAKSAQSAEANTDANTNNDVNIEKQVIGFPYVYMHVDKRHRDK